MGWSNRTFVSDYRRWNGGQRLRLGLLEHTPAQYHRHTFASGKYSVGGEYSNDSVFGQRNTSNVREFTECGKLGGSAEFRGFLQFGHADVSESKSDRHLEFTFYRRARRNSHRGQSNLE